MSGGMSTMDTEYTFKQEFGIVIARVYGRSGAHDVLFDMDDVSVLYRFDYLRVSRANRSDDRWANFYVSGVNRTEDRYYPSKLLHHAILGDPPSGMVTDHINGNGLDNRRRNLRHVSKAINAWNKDPRFLCHQAPYYCPGVGNDGSWFVRCDQMHRGRFSTWLEAVEFAVKTRADEHPDCRVVLLLDVMRAAYELAAPGSEPHDAAKTYLNAFHHDRDIHCIKIKAVEAANMRIPPSVLAERGPDPLAECGRSIYLSELPSRRNEAAAMVRLNRYVLDRRLLAPNANYLN